MDLIDENGYKETMTREVLPYLKAREKTGCFSRIPGQSIYYRAYAADDAKADLVLLHGFTEGVDKFNETTFYFLKEGFNVWQMQQRGHGMSYRETDDPSLVHIRDYKDLIEDLHYFVHDIMPDRSGISPLPLYLYAHSMGGCVSALYLETYPKDFKKAVLSSPMLELDGGDTPIFLANIYALFMILTGRGKHYLPGTKPFDPHPDFEGSSSTSRERYEYWFDTVLSREDYHTCAPSMATARQFLKMTKKAVRKNSCSKIQADVLLLQAEHDTVVRPGGQEEFIKNIGSLGHLIRIKGAKHEIYMSVNDVQNIYWKEILDFLSS